jgi:hypothetical protein
MRKGNAMIKTSFVHRIMGGALIVLSLLAGTANAQSLSDASLKGTYGFRFYGRDFVNFPAGVNNEVAAVGVFTANGTGVITGGSVEYNDGGNICRLPVTSGGYTVSADGLGSLTLITPVTVICTTTISHPTDFNSPPPWPMSWLASLRS